MAIFIYSFLCFFGFLPRIPGISEDSYDVLERTPPPETPSLLTCSPPTPAQKNSTSPLQQPPPQPSKNFWCFETMRLLGATPPDMDSYQGWGGGSSHHFFLLFLLFRQTSLHSFLFFLSLHHDCYQSILCFERLKTKNRSRAKSGRKTSPQSERPSMTVSSQIWTGVITNCVDKDFFNSPMTQHCTGPNERFWLVATRMERLKTLIC